MINRHKKFFRLVSTLIVVAFATGTGIQPTMAGTPPVVILDAGHGGGDPGAVGNGMKEKDITLEVTQKVRDILKGKGYTVIMTRDNDSNPSLDSRVNLCKNNSSPDMLVSIHVNSGGGTGTEAFYTDRYSNLTTNSKALAQRLADNVAGRNGMVKRGNNGIKHERESAPGQLALLTCSKAPSALIELAFIDAPSSKPDINVLRNQRSMLAQAIADAMMAGLPAAKPVVSVVTSCTDAKMIIPHSGYLGWSYGDNHATVLNTDTYLVAPKWHRGIDIYGDPGETVFAAADGILYTDEKRADANSILKIDHPTLGVATQYTHIITTLGHKTTVKRGDPIGKIASFTNSHLHFSIKKSLNLNEAYADSVLDPSSFLSANVNVAYIRSNYPQSVADGVYDRPVKDFCYSATAPVIAYRDANFAGVTQNFAQGTFLANRSQLNVVGNDSISSLKVAAGYQVRACQHELAGICRVFESGNYASLGDLNDQISSLEVSRK
jgi:N-acetylmuramoyl-L-alanine amidase